MIATILIWLALIYIGLVVIWRLFLAVMTIVAGYRIDGCFGAIAAAIMNFLWNVWDLAKFALLVLVLALVLRGCSS